MDESTHQAGSDNSSPKVERVEVHRSDNSTGQSAGQNPNFGAGSQGGPKIRIQFGNSPRSKLALWKLLPFFLIVLLVLGLIIALFLTVTFAILPYVLIFIAVGYVIKLLSKFFNKK